MTEPRHSPGLSRRRFLTAMTAGAMAVRRPASATPAPVRPAYKVGVLLPRSNIRLTLGEDLLAGMRMALGELEGRAGRRRVDLIPADTGIGPALTILEAGRLIEEHRVDLLAGVATPGVAARLGDVLDEKRTVLVVSDAGADVVAGSGRTFYASLGYWQANWAMGDWAARNLGRRAVVAASFYESGYDSLYAAHRGVEEGGGEVVDTCVTHVPPAMDDIGRAIAVIRAAKPDFVYALYSGPAAGDFVRAYARSGLARHVPLVGSGFLVDETLLPALGTAALGIRSCLSWGSGLHGEVSRAFADAFERATGRQPDVFAVLGYETARLVADSVAVAERDGDRLDGLRDALMSAAFEGPRGWVTMNPDTHVAGASLYLREVRRRSGAVVNEVVGELRPIADLERWVATLRSGPKTGWLNAYLSV